MAGPKTGTKKGGSGKGSKMPMGGKGGKKGC
jgi:hypothetical protein